jgi:hypothetical protein
MVYKRYVPEAIHGFTTEELQELRYVIERSWNYLADDLAASGEEDEEYSRYDVTELALDGDRWKWTDTKEGTAEIIGKLQKLGWNSKEWREVIDMTLPSKFYSV